MGDCVGGPGAPRRPFCLPRLTVWRGPHVVHAVCLALPEPDLQLASSCLQCAPALPEVGAEGTLEDSAVGQDLGPEAGLPALDPGAVCQVDKDTGPRKRPTVKSLAYTLSLALRVG